MCLRRAKIGGFTLTELMIVVAIIGILAAIGYPQYQQYILRSKRADATAGLSNLANMQERFYSNASPPSYTTTLTALGYGTSSTTDGYWTLSITDGTNAGFTIQAVAGGNENHTDDDCNTLTLNNLGTKTSTPQAPGTTPSKGCWN